jgi:uncharacterized lipoprotein YddW (UPF0748 family)
MPVRRLRASHLLLLLLGLALAAPTSAAPAAQQSAQQMRALWVDQEKPGARSPEEIDELLADASRAGINTLFVQVRRHGDALYNRTAEPRAALPSLRPAHEFDALDRLIERAHPMGIKVHAWLVIGVTCRDRDPLRGHPQHVCTAHGPAVPDPERWTTATFGGQQIGDIDYGHPSAVHYLERLVQDLLREYPALDGIHYDFIRYAGQTYGYNQVSLDRFRAAYGRPAGQRPGPGDAEWAQWRRDRLTELVRRLYIRAKSVNWRAEISAATITWGGLGSAPGEWQRSAAYDRVYQDWRAWLEEGIIDFAVPMHYFSDRSEQQRGWYDSWLRWDRENTGRRAIVPGVGAWLNPIEQNIGQIARAILPDESGRTLAGVALFSYNQPLAGANADQRRAGLDLMRSTVFAAPAQAPVWPWIASPTAGHLQGIAALEGQVLADAHITLFREGAWVRELSAASDGWYGAVELEPGNYTIAIRDRRDAGRAATFEVVVRAGEVTSGP